MTTETVLITGASSGIGLELARCFANAKSDLVLLARREERLRQLAAELQAAHGVQVRVIVKDLAAAAAPREIADELATGGIAIDVLVNNAGFGERGTFFDLGLERQMNMLQVNIQTLTELTRRLLPAMIERRRGGVLNVASTAAFQPGPWMTMYFATKAYVLHFSEGLAEELLGKGVHVTCLCPGATATEFFQQAHAESAWLFRLGTMSAARVARSGYRGFRQRRAIVVPGWGPNLLAQGVRITPRWIVRKITKFLNG
jgi:hypothetical protein